MIVSAIEGVLRDPETSEVIPSGRVIYRALADNYGLALLSDEDRDAQWLVAQGFTDHNFLVTGKDRLEQIAKIRQRGSVDFLVESSPQQAAASLQASIPVLFFALPAYTAADFHPGTKRLPTSWSTLLDESTRQRALRAADKRLDQEIL